MADEDTGIIVRTELGTQENADAIVEAIKRELGGREIYPHEDLITRSRTKPKFDFYNHGESQTEKPS